MKRLSANVELVNVGRRAARAAYGPGVPQPPRLPNSGNPSSGKARRAVRGACGPGGPRPPAHAAQDGLPFSRWQGGAAAGSPTSVSRRPRPNAAMAATSSAGPRSYRPYRRLTPRGAATIHEPTRERGAASIGTRPRAWSAELTAPGSKPPASPAPARPRPPRSQQQISVCCVERVSRRRKSRGRLRATPRCCGPPSAP